MCRGRRSRGDGSAGNKPSEPKGACPKPKGAHPNPRGPSKSYFQKTRTSRLSQLHPAWLIFAASATKLLLGTLGVHLLSPAPPSRPREDGTPGACRKPRTSETQAWMRGLGLSKPVPAPGLGLLPPAFNRRGNELIHLGAGGGGGRSATAPRRRRACSFAFY